MNPIEMPALFGTKDKKFQLGFRQQITPANGGFLQTIDRTTPMWWAEYATKPLFDEALNEVQAFLDQLEGSTYTFLGFDPSRIMPYAYQDLSTLSDPWTQPGQVAPRITAGSYLNSTLTLDRMASGAVISKRDYIAVYDAPAWRLFRVVSPGVANPAGQVTVGVTPRPKLTNLNIPIRYRRPGAEMKIIGDITETSSVGQGTSFSFRAVQYIEKVG